MATKDVMIPEFMILITTISAIYLLAVKVFISKIQSEFITFRESLAAFQKDISIEISKLDKNLAVKSNIIDFLHKEVEELKYKVNKCKNCRGGSDE